MLNTGKYLNMQGCSQTMIMSDVAQGKQQTVSSPCIDANPCYHSKFYLLRKIIYINSRVSGEYIYEYPKNTTIATPKTLFPTIWQKAQRENCKKKSFNNQAYVPKPLYHMYCPNL